jgi:hypothetical protein
VVLGQHRGCVSSCNFSKDGERADCLAHKRIVQIADHACYLMNAPDSLIVSAGYDSNVNVWCNHTHQLRNTYKVSFIPVSSFAQLRYQLIPAGSH